MPTLKNIKILFIAGFGPIVQDTEGTRALYKGTLRLPLEEMDGYLYSDTLEGAKHFGLWPLSGAAESCFGTKEWPTDVPVPSAAIEFEVSDLKEASEELVRQGYVLFVKNKKEPWGQSVTRFMGPDKMLVSLTHTPHLHT